MSLPILFVVALEGGLRVFGFGHSYPLFVEAEQDPGYLRTNDRVVRRFMADERQTPNLSIRPVFFPRQKAPGTFRIFVQGGSSAEGFPYGYGAAPAGMLQQRLQRTFPDRRIEVITTAMSAVNTYTLLSFVDEIIEQHPDAVVVYAGHNEYVGLLGVASGYSVGRLRPVVLAFMWVTDLRIFQLMQRAANALSPAPERRTGPHRTLMATIVREQKIPYGSSLYFRGVEQYRANMTAILSRYRKAGIPVFIGTLASNERDQRPFISGHAPEADADAWQAHFDAGQKALESEKRPEALAEFDKALEIDDAHAEGHYARGRALERLGRYAEARQAYLAAKDRDELRFRAPEAINQTIRKVTAEQGAHLVDVQDALVRGARNGIIGNDLMIEHLHPNLRGYFLLADAYYDAFRAARMIGPWETPISREQAWKEIPVTEVDQLYGEHRIASLMADWPFVEQKVPYEPPDATNPIEAIALDRYRRRSSWPDSMRRLLRHYRSAGNAAEAAKTAVLLAEAFPYDAKLQSVTAELLLSAGLPNAGVYLGHAIEMAPPRYRQELLSIRQGLGEGDEASAVQRLSQLNGN